MITMPIEHAGYVANERFEENNFKIDRKFEELTTIMLSNFDRADERFDSLETRLGSLEERFGGFESDLKQIKDHFGIKAPTGK